jgi:HNH endonuclease
MNGDQFMDLFDSLRFEVAEYRLLLRHPALTCSLYFNRRRDGLVYFTGYRKDAARFPPGDWERMPAQQKKDDRPELITVRPLPGRERAAFERLLMTAEVSDEALDDQAEAVLRQRHDIGPTEIERLTKARRGQGSFREELIAFECRCRVTGVDDPALLTASHIKPWRVSTDEEKLDRENGLLLAPHIDRLFDRGYISFSDSGKLLVASTLGDGVLAAWGIDGNTDVGSFSARQKDYLHYHRTHVFHDHESVSP